MLEELEIRNLGPIRHAALAPAAGMTAITGETGAGKSMLLNALRLISGGNASARMVSPGADEAWAQGIFIVADTHPAVAMTKEAGVEPEDGEIFLSRTLPAKGRSRAVLGGHSTPRAVLHDISNELVAIHGQADQLRMASPSRQREFLDAYAQDDEPLSVYRAAWNHLNDCESKLRSLSEQESDARQRADYLRESIDRIDRVDPHAGEDEGLKALRDRIENAAAIAQGVGGAIAALDPSQVDSEIEGPGAVALVGMAVQSLRATHVHGPLDEAADRLESVNAELSDVMFSLSGLISDESEHQDLDHINERIHDLEELLRRWGPTLADVLSWRERAGYELEDLDASPERVQQLRNERDQAFQHALEAAKSLSKARTAAAVELSEQVTGELESLAMSGASLSIEVKPRVTSKGKKASNAGGFAPLDANGMDDIRFLFTPFPGSEALPMGKSASGGELSRLMLAMELTAAGRDGLATSADVHSRPMTFVFDEVDAGVGGMAAAELGKRLARLAQNAQVIVVTHLAQVASWADAQFVVAKGANGDEGMVETTVHEVRGIDREKEIARMLAGSESETSLDHARELLKSSVLK